ncbi:hypothetical protein LSAT2_026801, partial [Lamellibrachia satsuma]
IDEDFEHLFSSQAGNFTSRWEIVAPKLLKQIQLDIRDASAMRMIAELNNPQLAAGVGVDVEDMDEDYSPSQEEIAATVLVLLPSLLPPRPVATLKSRKKKWKPSIAEGRKAFIDLQKRGTDLAAYLRKRREECQKRGVTRQPQILALGDTILVAKEFFLLYEEVIYEVDSLVKAVDICFKIFFVLNAQYPAEAADVWTFIQKGLFNITTPYDVVTPRVIELLGHIKC